MPTWTTPSSTAELAGGRPATIACSAYPLQTRTGAELSPGPDANATGTGVATTAAATNAPITTERHLIYFPPSGCTPPERGATSDRAVRRRSRGIRRTTYPRGGTGMHHPPEQR